MKRLGSILLALSLAANVALALVYWQRPARDSHAALRGDAEAEPAALDARAASGSPSTSPAAEVEPAASPGEPLLGAEFARLLESDDLPALVSRLRAEGFPERVILWLIGEKIDQREYYARRAKLPGGDRMPGFWESTAGFSPEVASQFAQLMRERRAELQRLVGTEYWDESASYGDARFGFLSADKLAAVRRIEADASEMRSQLQGPVVSSLSPRIPEDAAKLKLIEDSRRKDLAELLTPEELELYDLTTSRTANLLRGRLDLFQPTEQEFRELFALQRVFDDKYDLSATMDPQLRTQRQRDQEQLDQQIRGVLGEQRYAEYERSLDGGYRAALKITQHFQLPPENAAAVFELQKEFNQRAAQVAQSMAHDRASASAALNAVLRDAKAELTPLLGAEGVEALRQASGSWLNSMEYRANPPTLRRP